MNNRLFQLQNFAPPVQLLFFFCFFFVANLLQLGINQGLGLNSATGNSLQVLGMMSINQILGFLLPALVFVALLPKPVAPFFHFKKVKQTSDLFVLVILALGTLLLVLGLAEMISKLSLGQTADDLQTQRKNLESSALQMNSVFELVLRILVMALLPAICEELFFRGVLQRMFHSFLKKPVFSILATALVFALFHASWYNYLPITVAGFLLGFIYFYTGNIWYNIILHFLVNGSQIVIAYLQANTSGTAEESSFPLTFAAGFVISGLIICLAAIRQLRKGKENPGLNWAMPYNPPGQN